jgi:uncharacterized protein (TIGR02466 family)
VKHDLFITDLWEFDFPYHKQFKPQILNFIKSSPEAEYHLKNNSNAPSLDSYGGYELDIENDLDICSFFSTQLKKLLTKVEEAHDWEKGSWINIDPWLNINKKGSFNPPHIHPGNDYSGVYYVSFPPNSGKIHFLDPRPQHRVSSPNPAHKEGTNWYATKNPYDSSIFTYEVTEGKIIIFPSWLMHYVDPNPGDDLRISIAFNVKFFQEE